MIAFFISSKTLIVKDAQTFDRYSFAEDIDFAEKSTILVGAKPDVENDDFVVCKDGNETVFVGICENVECDDSGIYTVKLLQKERMFDRRIFVGTESLISSTGIEDFIKSEIDGNWVDSGDEMTDRPNYTVTAITHTTKSAKANVFGGVEYGIYNLKTFIGNCLEHYRVHITFDFDRGEELVTSGGAYLHTDKGQIITGPGDTASLKINIYVDDAPAVPIDVTVSDVTDYNEIYSVDVLAKLMVRWKNNTTEVVSDATYYLKTDRTITTDPDDPDRAEGITKAVYYEADTSAEMAQKASDEFSSNSYQHRINFALKRHSRAYNDILYYVGRPTIIKTITGVQQSIVTGRTVNEADGFVNLAFGKLKVTLIDKLRGTV